MDYKSYLKQASEVVMLNEVTMHEVAIEKDSLKPGLMILALSTLAGAFGLYFFPYGGIVIYRPDIWTTLWVAARGFIVSLVGLYVVGYALQEFFKAKLTMEGFVKIMSFGSLIMVINILPRLYFISALWALVILVMALRKIAKLDWPETAVLLLVVVGIRFLLS